MASSSTRSAGRRTTRPTGTNVHPPVALRVRQGDGTAAGPAELPADPGELRQAAGRIARDLPPGSSTLAVPDLDSARSSALGEGLTLGAYRYSQAAPAGPAPTEILLAGALDPAALERGHALATDRCWARDLANTPAGTKTPDWLARQAVERLAPLGVDVVVREEQWLQAERFGGVLAVGAGAAAPPRLVQASWRPRGARPDRHLVLVGKGITFDTGGLNRKVGDGMRLMHTDMSGAAAVLAAVAMIARERVPVRVTALVPSAENAVSGGAYRPGDVITHVGGRTSEIHNTDAEGRLVLADALAYAAARLRPTALVDVATLTGAMKTALGLRVGGLFATSDELAGQLIAAGEGAGEPLWRMPLAADYEGALHSDVADATNSPGNPGAITAALFLQHFTGGLPWAHLDIAGPARLAEDDGLLARGATGFGARLLHEWATSLA